MRVEHWQLIIYEAQTSKIRDQLNSDARASRLRALDFELRASPFGPTCWTMTLSTVQGPDASQVSAALLDTVKLYLNGSPDPVYTGRVAKLPGLDAQESQFEIHGHYRLAKTVFSEVDVKNYSGPLWFKVKGILEAKLGAGNVLVPDDDSVRVENWTIEDKNIKLDALARRISDLLGGGLALGFRADGKFVMGRRPLEPVRTLGLGQFEAREAQLANRLYVSTGYDPRPQMVFEEAASLQRDGPLEESEDLSGLVTTAAAPLTSPGWGAPYLILDYEGGTRRIVPYSVASRMFTDGTPQGLTREQTADGVGHIVLDSRDDSPPPPPPEGETPIGGDPEALATVGETPGEAYQAFLTFQLPTLSGLTAAHLSLPIWQDYVAPSTAWQLEIRAVSGPAWQTRAQLEGKPLATVGEPVAGDYEWPGLAPRRYLYQLDPTRLTGHLVLTTVSQRTVTGDLMALQIGTWQDPTRLRILAVASASDVTINLSGTAGAQVTATDPVTGTVTAQGTLPQEGALPLDLGWGVVLSSAVASATQTSFRQVRAHAENLFVEKYGPTLRATAQLPDLYVAPGGRGRYRYGDGQDVYLIDYSARYTLADGRFTTTMTGGSKSRYNAAQQSRLTAEELSRRISRLEGA